MELNISEPTGASLFGSSMASLMFPREPAGPAVETVNCGCQSLPLDGIMGGQARRAQGVLRRGDRAQSDSGRVVNPPQSTCLAAVNGPAHARATLPRAYGPPEPGCSSPGTARKCPPGRAGAPLCATEPGRRPRRSARPRTQRSSAVKTSARLADPESFRSRTSASRAGRGHRFRTPQSPHVGGARDPNE